MKPTPPLTSLLRSSMIYSPDLRTRSYDFSYLRLHDRQLHVLELFNLRSSSLWEIDSIFWLF